MEIRKAERKKAKLRLGIAAPSGGGKTFSALKLAFGLGGKVGMIDTEHGSGDLYSHLGEYDIINIEAPYKIEKYLEAIRLFEKNGYDTIIIDSLSHAWSGSGGLLDVQGKIADSGKGNSYTAWRNVTPLHNDLVETMLQSKCHIIAAMRSKQEYVQEKVDGKTIVKKIGLAPVQRDGMEYEFTIMLDIDSNHYATATKDRTGLFDGEFFRISEETGGKLLNWLEMGVEPIPVAVDNTQEKLLEEILELIKNAKSSEDLKPVKVKIKGLTDEPRSIAIVAGEKKNLELKAAENEKADKEDAGA